MVYHIATTILNLYEAKWKCFEYLLRNSGNVLRLRMACMRQALISELQAKCFCLYLEINVHTVAVPGTSMT